MRLRIAVTFVLTCLVSSVGRAQSYTAAADFFFYGDNTEFSNRFREGETLFGASGRIFLDIVFNETVVLRGGVFGLGRFGSHEFLEHAEPMIALEVARGPSRFIFGSLETVATRHDIVGPDYETPHGLLPPLQRETLAFTRGQEMGLQWLVHASRINHDAWINWQRLNYSRRTASVSTRATVAQFACTRRGSCTASGISFTKAGNSLPLAPSVTARASRLESSGHIASRAARIVLDGHPVVTRHVPDRETSASSETGLGIFLRGALEQGPWRGHLIVWRSRDTLKAEGDANYLAQRLDGPVFHKVRDYGELGLTRQFRPAAGVHLFAAARLHRVESSYEYSFRIVGRVRLRHPF